MEQNKVLMIVVSVAFFVAALIGVGVALLYPRQGADGDGSVALTEQEFDPIEYVRRPEAATLEEPADDEQPAIIVYGDTEDESATSEGEPTETGGETPGSAVTDEPDAEVPVIRERPAVQKESTPEATAPAVSSSEGLRSDTPSVPTPQPSERQVRVTEYWIQLIASPSRDRVETARTTLADYSLSGRVTTRSVEGTLYYRLRVGPYASKPEAEKFLHWIRDIDQFGQAYISEEYPLRTVQNQERTDYGS